MRLRAVVLCALGCSFGLYLPGQSVISTRSGLINFTEGMVFVDGQPLAKKFGTYDRLKTGSTLVTDAGRAEVLLTPNTYLRIGENSSVRMMLDNLSDTQVEILAGSAILDSESAPDGDFVKIIFKDSTIRDIKKGRYRIDADPPQLRVYEGGAEVVRNGEPTKIESAQIMPLDGAPVVRRMTEGADGLLDIWSDERQSLIASNLLSSSAISDPLLDQGTDAAADYSAYVGPYGGYVPLASIPPSMGGYYGYGSVPVSPFGYSPYGYSALAYSSVQPYEFIARPVYSRLVPNYGLRFGTLGSTSVFGVRSTGIQPTGIRPTGTIYAPRPVFAPRPASMGHVGGARAVGHR